MTDDLQQLLRRADAATIAPALDATTLPRRVRRAARNQHRVVAVSLALSAVCTIIFALLPGRSFTPAPVPVAISPNGLQSRIEIHEQTAALLEQFEHSRSLEKNPT